MTSTPASSLLPAPAHLDGPYSVVMVCTGNICRSAMAEVVLRDRLAAGSPPEAGSGIAVSSAGVSSEEHGHPMDSRARRVLVAHGYGEGHDAAARATGAVIAGHRAHRITDAELMRADLLLAMTAAHHRELERRLSRLGRDGERVRMYRAFDRRATGEGSAAVQPGRLAPDVMDPWYGTMADFEDTLVLVERVSDVLAPALLELTGPGSRRA